MSGNAPVWRWRAALLACVIGASACSSGGPDDATADESAPAVAESSSTTTTTPLATTTTPSAETVPAEPWVAAVDGPRGVLGPEASAAVDPERVEIVWDEDRYLIPEGFQWNEAEDGGFLLFDRGRAVITGDNVAIVGAVFADIDAGGSPVVSAAPDVGAFELRQFRIEGGTGSAAVGTPVGRGEGSIVSNFEIRGFDGDGIKPPAGSTITDGYVNVAQRAGSEKHYDGVQITGRSGVTLARLQIRLDGQDNLNSAIFVHDHPQTGAASNDTTITDIDIVHAAYSFFPLRIMAGPAEVRDVVGRGPVSADERRPTALILHRQQVGIDWDSIWVAFDGEVDLEREG